MKQDWETLIPLLIHIQANLDGDLALAALSRKADNDSKRGFAAQEDAGHRV